MIAVTGANGFVGRQLVKHAAELGIPVRGLNRDKLGDLANKLEISSTLFVGCSVVIHLGARAHITKEIRGDHGHIYRSTNLNGTKKAFNAAREAGVGRFVFVSTVKVAGESTKKGAPIQIDAPARPEGPYALSKAEAEYWLLAQKGGPEVVIIRPPLVYGPGVKANMALMRKLVQIGLPLPLAGIDNERSLVSVANLASALLHAALHRRAPDHVWVLADGPPLPTIQIIRYMAAALGSRPRLARVPLPVLQLIAKAVGRTDSLNRLVGSLAVDDSSFRSILGWTPLETCKEGLSRMMVADEQCDVAAPPNYTDGKVEAR